MDQEVEMEISEVLVTWFELLHQDKPIPTSSNFSIIKLSLLKAFELDFLFLARKKVLTDKKYTQRTRTYCEMHYGLTMLSFMDY